MAEEKKTVAAEETAATEKKPAAKKAPAKKAGEAKPAAEKKAPAKKPAAKKAEGEKPAAEKKAPAKKPAAKKAADTSGKIKITLKKSLAGRTKNQILVAHSLGLKRPGDVTLQPDNAPTKGKISKISFLVVCENG